MSLSPSIGAAPVIASAVDLHCHILPGIDDGPETMADAVALCRVLWREGVTLAVATPHQLGRYDTSITAARIRAGVRALQEELTRRRIGLEVRPGAEIRLDERIDRLLQDDLLMTLNDARRFLLLELPMGLAVDPEVVLERLSKSAMHIVLAHAERYDFIRADQQAAQRWIDAGMVIQVNCGSLTGAFGPVEQSFAWNLLSRGIATVVASDAHGTGQRRPYFAAAVEMIQQKLGRQAAQDVCVDNPRKILQNDL
jgi:protein-tyrosine phosphatase